MKLKPVSVIKADIGIEPDGRVQRYFVDLCANHMNKYIPRSAGSEGGSLRGTTHKTSHSITYEMPYAHAQYVGFTTGPVRHYTTPGTGPYWDRRMVSAEIETVVSELQDYIKRGVL